RNTMSKPYFYRVTVAAIFAGGTILAFAAAAPSVPAPAGAATGVTSTATAPTQPGRRGGAIRGRGAANLGPIPEVHAAVANTLPGLLGKPLRWKSTAPLVVP